MPAPLIVVNFKAYGEVCGPRGLELALACQAVSEDTGVHVIPCPQMVDLARVCARLSIPVWAQRVDGVGPGGHTGHTTAAALAGAGAAGTLLNHSECRMRAFDIDAALSSCRAEGITTCVCSNNVPVSRAMAALGPDYVAVEPPELIGGDISVTTADPSIVSETVDAVRATNPSVGVLCGAGVKDGKDVSAALDLGAQGVLLASGVVKARDPAAVLRDMASTL